MKFTSVFLRWDMDIYRSRIKNFDGPQSGSKYFGKKSLAVKIILGAAVAAVVAAAVLAVKLTAKTGLEEAIAEYDDGDYVEALIILNSLAPQVQYEKGEAVYYYRCKALNRLAERTERRYRDELTLIAAPGTPKDRRERELRELEEELGIINGKVQGDLRVAVSGGAGRIVPGGRFYDEFISRFKGSRYIEDLDFEEIEKIERSDGGRFLGALSNFYAKYPRTLYLSQVVRMLFANLEKSGVDLSTRADMLTGMIVDYARRYPTSSEIHRIFTCRGDEVNLRSAPGIQGKVVGKAGKDEMLIQIEKSMDTAQVGDTRDYWYRVMSLRGLQGWIFGKFMAPFDLSKYGGADVAESWTFEENFGEWSDSNTPKNWLHLPGSDTFSVLFYEKAGRRLAKLSSAAGGLAGLYRRTPGSGGFVLKARGRFVSGDPVVLVAFSTGSGYYGVRLGQGELDVCGRKVPMNTGEWRDYTIASDDGRFASVSVEGELLLNKIPPGRDAAFAAPGMYCLVSKKGESSSAELEYVRLK